MTHKIADLRNREVINIRTGLRLGFVCDVLFNTETGQIVSLVVPGAFRLSSLLGRQSDCVIPWECVKRVGDDIILVDSEPSAEPERSGKQKRRFW